MVIKTASPGVFVQEIDLTRGTADAITQNVGFCAGPFEKGPVDQITLVTEEVEFQRIFGNPTDDNFEYWHTINNFLEYSGTCYVVRCDDSKGDATDVSVGNINPQKMRNGTDLFSYSEETGPGSAIYIKNQDDYFTNKGGLVATDYEEGERVQGTGGSFIGRTPGAWTNGLAIAVIDTGADFQFTLKSTEPELNTSVDDLFVNGGDADFAPTDILDGGKTATEGEFARSLTAKVKINKGNFDEDDENTTGTHVARYAKLVASEDFSPRTVSKIEVVDSGAGMVDDQGDANGLLTEVSTTGGSGTGLKLNLTLVNGVVSKVEQNLSGAEAPQGYEDGDIVTAVVPGATSQPTFELTLNALENSVIQFGTATGVIVRAEESADEPLYYVVAIAPQYTDGVLSYGEWELGDDIRNKYGGPVGSIVSLYELGDFVFYKKTGNQIVDIIWEPVEYSRNQGMAWFWNNRPNDGEVVFSGKSAVNSAGNPIEAEDSTIDNPKYKTVEGPATVTASAGSTISWSGIREKWIVNYVPQKDDLIFDTTGDSPVAYSVLFVNDWYAQQVAFEGIPWLQFGPRPKTSASAEAVGAEYDEMNILIYDAIGDVTGIKGTVVEQYILCSKLKGAKTVEGSNNFYKDLINNNSEYLYSNERVKIIGDNPRTNVPGNQSGINQGRVLPNTVMTPNTRCALLQPRYGAVDFNNLDGIANPFDDEQPGSDLTQVNYDMPYMVLGGQDQLSSSIGELQAAYRKIAEENVSDLDYIIQGPACDITLDGMSRSDTGGVQAYNKEINASIAKANYLVALGEELKNCMVVITPPRAAALDPVNAGVITQNIIKWADRVSSSSYAVMDSGYKYTYDRFRDKYEFLPLNADIAGTMANTALVSEPFFSPAGMVRGQIKNVVKLGFDPSKQQRDLLYSSRVNPVVTFPGEGTVLYGDKTALAYSSAFSRINVRKLFIYVEREIAKISKSVLFEFNDVPTRVSFKNNVGPFLRDVQSKRGMIDFLVVCDASNNTPEVIDRNEFIADIYIKPSRSINFVQLTFVATKTGVSFGEAVNIARRNVLAGQ